MITVLSPGARSLIQDLGRPGYEHLGVPTSGAADPAALALANSIVGNPATCAGVEITSHGPTLRFDHDAVVAYVGPDADLFIDGTRAPLRHTVHLRAGQTLSLGRLHGGAYGYLAVAGGIDVPPVLGSRSSCTLSGLGPKALMVGDTLPPGSTSDTISGTRMVPRQAATGRTVRYLPGPHLQAFPDESLARFESSRWQVSGDYSRVGVRLSGSSVPVSGDSLPSLGMVTGAIQVPPSGEPIVLGPDHGTVGGYPILGVVVPEDLPLVMQSPGGFVGFARVMLDEVAVSAAPQPWCLDALLG